MNILFILPRFHTNQIGIANFFRKKGYKVDIHVANKGVTEDYSIFSPYLHNESFITKFLKLLKTKTPNNPYYLPSIFSYLRILKKIKPDVVIIREHCSLWTNFILAISFFYRFKVILTNQIRPESLFNYHNYSLKGNLRKTFFKFRLNFFKTYWATPLRDSYMKIGELPNRCFYLPFLVEVKDKKAKSNYEIGKFKILSIGKYIPRKSHDLLIRSIKKISKDFDIKIELTIVGEYSDKNNKEYLNFLLDLSRKLNLKDNVQFLMNIPFKDMENLYSIHDLVVVPAFNEVASISIIEALGYGIPAICSDSCGTRGYISNLENGAIFKSNNEESLSKNLKFFIKKICDKQEFIEICKRSSDINASAKTYDFYLKKILTKMTNDCH